MQGIFISYRRQDSQSAAGRLADHLKEHLGGIPIFRDVETIEPGVDFVVAINRALQSCAVLLAVIGPRWVSVEDGGGRRRLDDANDYTRLEIGTALKRDDVRVIPVLVEGAEMPTAGTLPEDLKALARRNAIELTDKRWEYDVAQLVDTLRRALGMEAPPRPAPPPVPPAKVAKPAMSKGKWIGLAAAGAAAALVLALFGRAPQPLEGPTDSLRGQIEADVARQLQEEYAAGQQQHTETPAAEAVVPAPTPTPTLPPTPRPAINLTGLWQDEEGGRHQILQQGNRLVVEGMSPDGYVAGAGVIEGRQGWVDYSLNGQPLRANIEVSADGRGMRLVIVDPYTGQREVLGMRRLQ